MVLTDWSDCTLATACMYECTPTRLSGEQSSFVGLRYYNIRNTALKRNDIKQVSDTVGRKVLSLFSYSTPYGRLERREALCDGWIFENRVW
jgi:hypothetical protein